jgi:hypothetical protein
MAKFINKLFSTLKSFSYEEYYLEHFNEFTIEPTLKINYSEMEGSVPFLVT